MWRMRRWISVRATTIPGLLGSMKVEATGRGKTWMAVKRERWPKENMSMVVLYLGFSSSTSGGMYASVPGV